ncbi:hypothetical protein GYMLUDRAFT_246127 [Collybiopsis luxurians FD-317 M1]|uniref:Uncharacterized protein n=1 Tax=Collybiopsis luxurians FD-317 M1 TaxID=944289 RepID=A0A0D0C7G9_9AGAR|nr:hypothetical protein GYMLUDRAFT_246127 [Collybiopsis luxurians FD-317 M1]
MSSSQSFTNQPVVSSTSVVPFSNALPSAPPMAKKMQHVAFECSMHLRYPSISIMDCIPTSLPTGLQPIYEDTYLANLSPEVLDRIDVEEWKNIFWSYPSCEYCASHNLHSTCSLHPNSLLCTTCKANYPSSKKFCSFKSIFWLLQFHILAKLPLIIAYCIVHPEELGLSSDGPRASEGKRKAVVSLNAFQKSQLLQQEGMHLGESSCEQAVLTLSHKGKEVTCDTVDVNVEMGAPKELDTMTLDYPEDVPPPPVPVPTPPAPIWKAIDNRSYHEVSSMKTWFFKPFVKRDPSDDSFSTWDEMIQTAIECIVLRISSLVSSSRKMMLEQDLWALADGLLQGAFDDLEEQLEQVASHDAQLKEKDEELTHLKSFVRHFKGDIPSSETQQLRETLEGQESEIESLKAKLAVSEESQRVAAEESQLWDTELAQLRQLFESV